MKAPQLLHNIQKILRAQLFSDSVWTFINRMILLFIPLVITPLMLTKLGKENYGIWLLIQSFTSYLGLLNLGLLQYLQNKVAGDYPTAGLLAIKTTYKSIQKFYFILAINVSILLILTLLLNSNLYFFNSEITFYFCISGLFFIWSFPTRVYEVVLRAIRKIKEQQIINTSLAIIRYLTLIILLLLNFGLLEIIILNGVFLIIPGIFFYFYLMKTLPGLTTYNLDSNRGELKKAIIPGFNFLVIQIASVFAFATDNFVIAANLDLQSVSRYGIAFSLIIFIIGIFSILPSVSQPTISLKYQLNDFSSIIKLYKNLRHILLYVAGVFSIILIFSGKLLFSIWVGDDVFPGYDIFILMVAFLIVQLILIIDDAIVMATMNHNTYSLVSIIEGTGNLIFSIILIKFLGLLGVILATVFMRIFTNGIYLPYKTSKILRMNYKDNLAHIFGGIFLILISNVVTFILLTSMPVSILNTSLAQIIGIILLSVTYYLMVIKFFKLKLIDL